ncbi:MAG: YggS family pyridoxal phosphate-dependent enzyme [Lentimicrobiaceae bacterium]|nr:YggS family pyridoxal phosphate-dependent enzyme [Lentimicrobiaceae bacterium]
MKRRIVNLMAQLPPQVSLVAVTKTHPVSLIMQAYEAGLRDFGENRVQEMIEKQPNLPDDVRWHLIGHLQTNKVKYIAPFVHMIHSIDSLKILKEINKQGAKAGRIIDGLLQIYIASEETKFGLSPDEAIQLLNNENVQQMKNIRIRGLMGMATFTENEALIKSEFKFLKQFYDKLKSEYFRDADSFNVLSMGMSGDYQIAIAEGSTLVRIGTAIFGSR